MHREMSQLLSKAKGQHKDIICAFIDIRGFSAFCETIESPNVGRFVVRVYQEILNKYFPAPSYFKTTGDGMLIIYSYDGPEYELLLNNVVSASCALVSMFPNFFRSDPIINFAVPTEIGIGISRGPACELVSEGKTIDYSGRILNLAARLMNMARPLGVVFDASLGYGFLEENQRKQFEKKNVFVRGISEDKPIEVYSTKHFTEIPAEYLRPHN